MVFNGEDLFGNEEIILRKSGLACLLRVGIENTLTPLVIDCYASELADIELMQAV